MTSTSTRPEQGRLPGYATLLAGQTRYQLGLLLRTPRALFAGVMLPVLLLVLRRANGHSSAEFQLSLVAGLAVLGVVSTAYVTHASNLVSARESGVLRRWRASPLPRPCFFAGRIAATVVLADASAVVTLLVARLTGTTISVPTLLLALVPISLGVLAWASTGTAITAFIPSASGAYPLLAATYLPVIFLSGGLGPAASSTEPHWLATLMSYLPAQPTIDGVTRTLQHGTGALSLFYAHDLVVLIAWIAAGLIASFRLFSWNPRASGKRPPRDARGRRHSRQPSAHSE
jgi:ABC-2 type transport system permease protein